MEFCGFCKIALILRDVADFVKFCGFCEVLRILSNFVDVGKCCGFFKKFCVFFLFRILRNLAEFVKSCDFLSFFFSEIYAEFHSATSEVGGGHPPNGRCSARDVMRREKENVHQAVQELVLSFLFHFFSSFGPGLCQGLFLRSGRLGGGPGLGLGGPGLGLGVGLKFGVFFSKFGSFFYKFCGF